ncbi:hypothetical protein SEPCBS119000_005714, partial [Sporothrix epigloea]
LFLVDDVFVELSSLLRGCRDPLCDVLGCNVQIDFYWERLLTALGPVYNNDRLLARSVIKRSAEWCNVLEGLLNAGSSMPGTGPADAALHQRAKKLKEKIQSYGDLRLHVTVTGEEYVGKVQQSDPITSWSDALGAFVLQLPRVRSPKPQADFGVTCREDLLEAFEKETMPIRSSSLATLDSLPKPEELFLRPPYHLIIADYGHQKIVVHSSHSPSLHLLGEYMKRWCRINPHDSRRPPAVEVIYNQSCWGSAAMSDMVTLTSEANNVFKFNPALVLAFVEGVLGYEKVSTEQGIWTYRRLEPFGT